MRKVEADEPMLIQQKLHRQMEATTKPKKKWKKGLWRRKTKVCTWMHKG